MMCAKPTDPFEPWTKQATQVFQFWISMWPVAPMFGVEWRFGKSVGIAPTPEFMKPFAAAFNAVPVPPAADKPAADQPERRRPTAEPTVIEATTGHTGVFEPIPPVAKVARVRPVRTVESPAPETVAEGPVPVAAPEPVAAPDPVAAPESMTETPVAETPVPTPVVEVAAEPAAPAPQPDAAPALLSDRPATLYDTAPAQPDDLKLLRGIGPGLERQLNGLGIYTFAQLAGFSPTDFAWIDDNLNGVKGRWIRDDWAGQARALMG